MSADGWLRRQPPSPTRRLLAGLGTLLLILAAACGPTGARSPKSEKGGEGAPVIKEMVPKLGRPVGGTYVVILGEGFREDETRVFFGREQAWDVLYVSPTELRVEAPSGPPGEAVDLVVEVGEEDSDTALRTIRRGAFEFSGLSRNQLLTAGALLILLALLGLPLFLVIGLATVLGYVATAQQEGLGFFSGLGTYGNLQPGLGATIFNWVTDMGGKPLFIAIPLFTFAGSLMSESGAPTRLVNVARALIGWFPGGLAWVTLLVCCFFTAFTGASGVTIIALGGLLFPILLKEKYGENYSLGLLTTGGSLGLLIPPSLPVIVYGIIAGLDTDRIWDAGIGPMILIVLLLGGHAVVQALRADVPRHPFSGAELARALKAAAFELPLPFVVVFGIKGGWFTPTEASAVTAVWVLIVECLIYRDIGLKELPGVIRRSMILVGGLIIIIGLALAFTTYLTRNEVPQRILALMQSHIDSRLAFLLMLNVFLLIVGCLMDIFSAILVVVPLIAPVALGFGVDPYHLAIIFLVNLEIGYSTPPVGINLFISSMRFHRPVFQLYRASLVFIGILLVGLMVITYVPALSLGAFDLPAVSVVNGKGEPITSLTITAGDEGTLKGLVSFGGIDQDAAVEQLKVTLSALEQQEKSLGLDYDRLSSDIRRLQTRVINAEGTDRELAEARTKIRELEKTRRPLDATAQAYEAARRRLNAVQSMARGLRWRCRNHPYFDESGESLELGELEAGTYRLTIAATSEKKHLAQAAVTVIVKPDADADDE